ncbi:hypothetical protein NEOLEDRAFT_1106320 [Neolentinus lepideus HHB14362 ss-1]|uniref:Uncharacterized protein n=1 Tax=Neolentinus lepideus HHB14362 ss-1 TaxID=1314782 RepID=A0A165VJ38_9AGAM|nr:hypothetical protein NEOLEDRAFT_1106320 [Neolentinus lepideus HHB14362 ss-1]
MLATLFSSTLFFALAIRSASADFSIDTPQLTQCGDAHVTWENTGAGPYNLIVVPASDPCSDVLADLGDHQGTSMSWKVNFPAGTQLMFSLEDDNGDEAWSGSMTVGGSSDASCLPAVSSSAAASSAAASSAAASSSAAVSSSAAASGSSARTTLVVSPAATGAAKAAATVSASSSGAAVPVGAANAGLDPTSGAFSVRQFSTPVMLLSAVAALVALA